MEKTIGELSKLCGISVRTLHYYDEIGLLHPSRVLPSGYRMYGQAELERLEQILFFREMGFPLREIQAMLDNPAFDHHQALRQHRRLLVMERQRLDGLIDLVDQTLKGEPVMNLNAFDRNGIDRQKAQYAGEARRRWGDTEAYRESQRRADGYGPEDWSRIEAEAGDLYQSFAACMGEGPDSPRAQQLVRQWQEHISRHYYPCTDEILAGLGQMYTADPRFTASIDEHKEGLAAFMSQAIAIYCGVSRKTGF